MGKYVWESTPSTTRYVINTIKFTILRGIMKKKHNNLNAESELNWDVITKNIKNAKKCEEPEPTDRLQQFTIL